MVGAGALVKPLLGFSHEAGVLIVGVVVIADRRDGRDGLDDLGAVHQGRAARRLLRAPDRADPRARADRTPATAGRRARRAADGGLRGRRRRTVLAEAGGWAGKPYVRLRSASRPRRGLADETPTATHGCRTQRVTVTPTGERLVDGVPQGKARPADLRPVGQRPGAARAARPTTGPLGPSASCAPCRTAASSSGRRSGSSKPTAARPRSTTRSRPRGGDLLRPRRQPDVQRRAQRQAVPTSSTSSR